MPFPRGSAWLSVRGRTALLVLAAAIAGLGLLLLGPMDPANPLARNEPAEHAAAQLVDDEGLAPLVLPFVVERQPLAPPLFGVDLPTPVNWEEPPIIWRRAPLPPPAPSPRPRWLQRITRSPWQLREQRGKDALDWLARHAHPKGGWSFAGQLDEKDHSDTGPRPSETAATALAMLPFLTAGYTHQAGPYREVLRRAVDRLLAERASNLQADRPAGDLHGSGWPVAQSWATLTLCESYSLTRDTALREPAQDAVRFLIALQHQDGSWSAGPDQPGDPLATAWAMSALRAGQLAGLDLPRTAVRDAGELLALNQRRLTIVGREPACLAARLLGELFRGQHAAPAIARLAPGLFAGGPSASDAEFNLFIGDLAPHVGGEAFLAWSAAMEDQLYRTQTSDGADRGSWHTPQSVASARGGRLGETALNALILMRLCRAHLSWQHRHQAEEF